MQKRKAPESVGALSRGNASPSPGQEESTKKLLKYARLKGWNCQIGVILGLLGESKLQEKLQGCGRYLAFREFLISPGDLKLRSGNFCNLHMLCPCCSAARSRRMLGRWLPEVFTERNKHQSRHYLLTLTWPPPRVPHAVAEGPAGEIYKLRANLAVGVSAWGKLWKRRVNRRSGPLRAVLGAILSVEVTHGEAGWHPHFHILLTLPKNQRVDAVELRRDWMQLTAGNQVWLNVLKQESDVVEVFKYAVKPADMGEDGKVQASAVEKRLLVLDALAGYRLVRGFGSYYGMKEPDLSQQESVEDLGEWVDLIFKWAGREYRLVQRVESNLSEKRVANE